MAQALAYTDKTTGSPAAVAAVPMRRLASRPVRSNGERPVPVDGTAEAALQQIACLQQVARETTLLEDGDAAEHVYKVSRGTLRMVKLLPDGRRCITRFLQPGDHVGLSEGETYPFAIEAVTDATVVRYPRRRFQALLQSDPRLMQAFFSIMGADLSATQERLLLLSRKSATERLASFLLGMADRTESDAAEDNLVELPMSRADVADYLGLTIETVSRLFSKLRAQRVIILRKAQQIVLLRRDLLEEMSEMELA